MPGPVLPSAAVRGNEGYGGDNKMSPKSLPKDLVRSPGRQVPRYRSAMMEGSPRSQKSGKSGKSPEKAKQTRRQRTAMLMADGTPKKTNGALAYSNAHGQQVSGCRKSKSRWHTIYWQFGELCAGKGEGLSRISSTPKLRSVQNIQGHSKVRNPSPNPNLKV